MTCTEVRQNWMLYLDRESDAELHRSIAEHLGRCPACAEWFARQQRLEEAIRDSLAKGDRTPALWGRMLDNAALVSQSRFRRRRLVVVGGVAAAAAVVLAMILGRPGKRPAQPGDTSGLAREAAALHQQWLNGEVRPDFASISELDVDRYFKAHAPFRVHCPPRSDVNFSVEGAGMRALLDRCQAGFIVGRVGDAPVSILVLDRSGLSAFPDAQARLAGGGRDHSKAGDYQLVCAVVADNVVVVVGDARPETLDRLIDAYGSYH